MTGQLPYLTKYRANHRHRGFESDFRVIHRKKTKYNAGGSLASPCRMQDKDGNYSGGGSPTLPRVMAGSKQSVWREIRTRPRCCRTLQPLTRKRTPHENHPSLRSTHVLRHRRLWHRHRSERGQSINHAYSTWSAWDHRSALQSGQQPQAFADNPLVKQLLEAEGKAALPLVLIDGKVHVQGRYPSASERSDIVREALGSAAEVLA